MKRTVPLAQHVYNSLSAAAAERRPKPLEKLTTLAEEDAVLLPVSRCSGPKLVTRPLARKPPQTNGQLTQQVRSASHHRFVAVHAGQLKDCRVHISSTQSLSASTLGSIGALVLGYNSNCKQCQQHALGMGHLSGFARMQIWLQQRGAAAILHVASLSALPIHRADIDSAEQESKGLIGTSQALAGAAPVLSEPGQVGCCPSQVPSPPQRHPCQYG